MNPKGTPANLKPFTKGDKRINRKGKPKDFTALRALAQQIAHEDISDGMTVTEAILRKWAGSKDPRLQMAFIEYAYGKPPQQVENKVTGPNGGPIQAKIEHAIDPDTAINIFDILAAAGVFESDAGDAEAN
jgi:hypothetical protein